MVNTIAHFFVIRYPDACSTVCHSFISCSSKTFLVVVSFSIPRKDLVFLTTASTLTRDQDILCHVLASILPFGAITFCCFILPSSTKSPPSHLPGFLEELKVIFSDRRFYTSFGYITLLRKSLYSTSQ